MISLYKEFKEFAVKGNMMDIAIGVIIGAAFNKVITAIVSQLVMPPLSLLTTSVNLSSHKWVLREGLLSADGTIMTPEVAIGFGAVLDAFFDFGIIAVTIFLIIKAMNRLRNRADDVEDTQVVTPKDIELLNKISNLLEKQNELLQSK